MKESLLTAAWCVAVVLGICPPAFGQPAATQPLDLKNLPANQWVARPLTGLPPIIRLTQSDGLCQGLTYVGDAGAIVACGDVVAFSRTPFTPQAWRLDLASGAWTGIETAFNGEWPRTKLKYGEGSGESFWGTQVCYAQDSKRIVGLTSTAMGMTGKTVELDWESKAWRPVTSQPAPPVLTGASPCYDPVNREVVLATGGFSAVGGSDGTWLYDCATRQWRRLEGPPDVEQIRQPAEKLRDRVVALRWLVWKNLEFRATGRDTKLDERARSTTLAKESAELVGELKKLGELAAANSAKAARPYHKDCLASAGRLLADAAGKLDGLDRKVQAGSVDELETLYRGAIVPAADPVEQAVAELMVTPEPRMSARLVYDPKNKLIVCFGGDGHSRMWGDTWVYHCEGRWWERRRPAVHPSPRASRAMAYDARLGQVVLIVSDRWGQSVPETWTYDAGGNQWQRWDVPAPRGAFFLEYDATAECLVAFNQDLSRAYALELDTATAKAIASKPSPEVELNPTDGGSILRDAATVKDLRAWKDEQDAWVKSVPANTWVEVPQRGTGRPNWGRTWSSIVYDPDRLELYYRDGGHGSYHGAVTDHYDLPTGRWFRGARRDEPCWPMGKYFCWGRAFSGAPWAIHTYKIGLYYNCVTHRLERYGTSYDPDLGVWPAQPVAPWPDSPKGGAWIPVFGVSDRQVIVPMGRYEAGSGAVAVLTAGGWQSVANVGAFPGVGYPAWEFQTVQYDPKRQRVLRMGPGSVPNQLWVLDLAKPGAKWTNATPTTAPDGAPLPESGREMVYIPKHDVFLMPDGAKGRMMTEMCVYHPAENVWSRVAIGTGVATAGMANRNSGTRSNGMAYDPESDLCYFIGAASNSPPMFAFRYVPKAVGQKASD